MVEKTTRCVVRLGYLCFFIRSDMWNSDMWQKQKTEDDRSMVLRAADDDDDSKTEGVLGEERDRGVGTRR